MTTHVTVLMDSQQDTVICVSTTFNYIEGTIKLSIAYKLINMFTVYLKYWVFHCY